jgi:putative salt-induced outer membrane protein YdiY
VIVALLCVGFSVARAQDDSEEEKVWFLTLELSSVATAGNSESNTFGFGGKFRRVWTRSDLRMDAGAIRTESALKTRTAVGTQDDFIVNTQENREKTAENYFVRGVYAWNVTEHFNIFGGADWLRNVFAGLESRILIAAGAGNTWWDNERRRFKTGYSVTYTFEENVVSNPFTNSNFPGLRLSYDYWDQLTASTQFTSVLTADLNLDNTDDVRVNVNFGLPIEISSKLAFKPELAFQWRNEPALTTVPLFDTSGTDTGETVLTPLEELDTMFTAALVLSL